MTSVDLILPDAGPLISLAHARRLDLIDVFNRPVAVLDVVKLECLKKPESPDYLVMRDWVERNAKCDPDYRHARSPSITRRIGAMIRPIGWQRYRPDALDLPTPPLSSWCHPGRRKPRRSRAQGGYVFHPDLIRHPDSCPTLVLNADYTPLSYYPLSVWPWQIAVKAVFLDRVDIVAQYEREVHSPNHTMKLPSVIALKQFVRPSQFPAFTRFNLFLRDKFECQYCGHPRDLTFDHVVPRAQGGRTTWENVVTACAPCNLKKGGRTPKQAHMPLHVAPIRPTSWHLQEHGRRFPPNYLHATWHDWLYWDVELEA